MSEKTVPALRFKGFDGDWERKKLGEVVNYVKGYAFRSTDYAKDGVRIVRVSDLINNRVSEETDKIFLDINKAKSYRNYYINYEDIIITTVGSKAELKDSAVGRAIIINDNNQYLLNQNLVKIFPDKNYSSQFIYNQLLMERYTKHIENIQRGNANQANITIANLWDYQIHYTENKEQTRIGNLFRKLDALINLRQQKHDKLVTLKKAMLSKMFPKEGEAVPELRFAGFSGDWERKKLGEIGDIVGGGTPSTSIEEYWHGDIDWYAPAEINGQIFVSSSQKKITELGLQKSSATVLPIGTVLFTSRAGIGKSAILAKKGATNQGFQSIVPYSNELNSYFVFSRTHELKRYAEIVGAGSTFVEVSGKQLAEMPLLIPSLPEQALIGNFFRSLDSLITLQKQELEKLKNIKKSLLDKMFV